MVNRQTKKFTYGLALCFMLIVLMSPILWSGEIKRCQVCGMDVSKYPHTKYVLTTTEGEELFTCGVQCGLTLHLRLKEKFKSAMTTDLLSNRSFDAQKGSYVYKSTVVTDMAPGFISFATRTNAEKFQKGFGGKVVTYQEALEIWKGQMK
jgi:nitrous oxide reductase accessory protein NosL